jgi:hypothetical protein
MVPRRYEETWRGDGSYNRLLFRMTFLVSQRS